MSNGGKHLLEKTTAPTGHERTLTLEIKSGYAQGSPAELVTFYEKYTGDGRGWLGRFANFWVEVRFAEIAPLVAGVPGDDLATRVLAYFTAAVGRGELTDGLAPIAARERVAGWLADAGVPHRRASSSPSLDLGRSLGLWLTFGERPWRVEFSEYGGDRTRHMVTTSYESIAPVLAHLEQAHGVPAGDGHLIDRFAAALRTLLGPERGAGQASRRLMTWYTAAGIEFVGRAERRREILRTLRENTDCAFWLTLGVSSIDDKIWFGEDYEYYPRRGDAGREYGYSVKTPYRSLAALVTYFEAKVDRRGHGDLENRLFVCFEDLVKRGELHDDGVIESNRNRVAGWFAEAGVEYKPDSSVWVSSPSS